MAMASIANCSLEISRISQLGIWCFGLKVVWRPHSCNLAMRPCVFFWKVKWFRNSGCFNFVSWNMIPMYSNSIQFTYSGDITYIHCWYLFLCLVDLILTHSSGVQGSHFRCCDTVQMPRVMDIIDVMYRWIWVNR